MKSTQSPHARKNTLIITTLNAYTSNNPLISPSYLIFLLLPPPLFQEFTAHTTPLPRLYLYRTKNNTTYTMGNGWRGSKRESVLYTLFFLLLCSLLLEIVQGCTGVHTGDWLPDALTTALDTPCTVIGNVLINNGLSDNYMFDGLTNVTGSFKSKYVSYLGCSFNLGLYRKFRVGG